jgi:hypothetical protein
MAGSSSSAVGRLSAFDLQWHESQRDVEPVYRGRRKWGCRRHQRRLDANNHVRSTLCDTNADAHANSYSDGNSDRYTNGDAHGYTYSNAHANSYSDGNSDRHTNGNANGYTYSDAHTNSSANSNAYSTAESDAASSADART